MQGKIVSRDLLESGYEIYCADLYGEGSEANLAQYPGTPFEYVDLRNYDEFIKFLKKVETSVVINCAEGDWNQDVFRACLEEKRNVIDLGSDIPMTKAQLSMNDDFAKAKLVAITGCGSTPGINNIMFKHASQFFKEVDTIELGFAWDSDIKKFVVPFSMESIVEELSDPAPYVENGEWLEKSPFETEVVRNFREIGLQKCYLVRHSETCSFLEYYKQLGVKNIRFYAGFPDHSLEVLKKIIELGLGKKNLLNFEKMRIRPVDALSRILTKLERPEDYTEKENLWVEVKGMGKKNPIRIMRMECIVFTLPSWGDAGCNIDTGFPASIIAQMILKGKIKKVGSFAPEEAVPTEEFFKELKKKGMTVYQDGVAIN